MKRTLKITLIIMLVIIGGVFSLIRLPSPLFYHDYSTVVLDQDDNYLRVFLNENEQWCFPPDEDRVPLKLKTAVTTYEDKRFFKHQGVDLIALGRAIIANLKAGEVVSGASTITMQVARLSRPKDRTIPNKVIEMVQAVKLDLKYNKEEILKLYLTHAPYGGNIIGYKGASFRYFGKKPEQLTWAEVATLAVLPNNPAYVNPMQRRDRLKEKRDDLLKDLYDNNFIDKETYQLAKAENVPNGQMPFNLSAPHLAGRLRREYEEKKIHTTISKEVQDQVNKIVQEYMEIIKPKGINNCAIVVAETDSREVKAYIGSNDFYDQDNSGRIDGVQMERSTGSVLKPFLYGLAMDRGMIIPESKIKDIPLSYGAYTPYNADKTFRGVVTVRQALIDSLNAPVISLLDQYGVEDFYDFLEQAGVTTLFRTPKEYGLPIILGGAEVNLWEITAMYNSLGHYGQFADLKVIRDERREKGEQLISKGSSYLVLDILKDLKRPGLEYFWKEYGSNRKIAWKTGTSYGNRDAWAVGVSPGWTIGVWIGNFEGQESSELTGVEAAGPLLFRILNSLENNYYQTWFEKPGADIKKIKVSANTGYRIKEDLDEMTEMVEVDISKSAHPLRYSPYEKVIYLNRDGTEEVCSLCWEVGDVQKVFRVIYPPEVIQYLKERGNSFYTVPPHKEDCTTVSNKNPLDFIYPQAGSIILIPRGIEGDYQQVKLKVAHSQKDSKVYWYLDSKYIGDTVGEHQQTMSLKAGSHQLYVIDEEGHEKKIKFYVDRK